MKKRGRPKGSKNKPKEIKRGRPKGSKNKPKGPVVKISHVKMKEGLYTSGSEDSFKSREQIQTEALYRGNVSVEYPDRHIAELSFEQLHEEMTRRSELRQKAEAREYNTTIEIQTDRPLAVGWFADVHSGSSEVDYERLKWEVDEIKRNPYMKVFLGGDMADSFCWNPAQFGDIANLDEQNLYLRRMLEYMGYENVLGAVVGNHEKWTRRTGLDMYTEIRKNIPVFDGVGTVDLVINGITYTGAIMHKAKGYSYFNPNHPQKRFAMENEGYDFVMSAHTHKGSEQSQIKDTAKGSKKVVFLSGKTFKAGDDFLDTQGNKRLDGDGLGTNWILFNHKKKMMIPLSSTAEVIEIMGM
jgi:hypothetical protein